MINYITVAPTARQEDSHDLDALIRAAHTRPTEDLIQRIIDKGLDYRGNYVGQVHAAYIWRKAVTSH